MTPTLFSGAWWKMINRKNLKQKISQALDDAA
jgi:hypothetical protein